MKMARGQNRRLNCLNTRGVFCEWMITSFIIALWLIIETNVDRFRESDVWNSLVRGHIPVSGLGGSVCHRLLHPWTLSNWFVFFVVFVLSFSLLLSLFLSFSLSLFLSMSLLLYSLIRGKQVCLSHALTSVNSFQLVCFLHCLCFCLFLCLCLCQCLHLCILVSEVNGPTSMSIFQLVCIFLWFLKTILVGFQAAEIEYIHVKKTVHCQW